MLTNSHVYAVVLAGGGGTRLWPKSRKKTPKQFLKLTGKLTMTQVTINRIRKLVDFDHIIVVTNQKHLKELKEQIPELPEKNIICEPAKKDTALAMLIGSLYAKTKDEQAIILNVAADAVIKDEKTYFEVMKAAVKIASQKNELVTVGITPQYPTSAYGYIKIGDHLKKIDRELSVFEVDNFTEKPNKTLARAYISTGKYFWNANMYVWSVDTIIKAFQKHKPDIYDQTKQLGQLSEKEFKKSLLSIYKKADSISIDYAISEKADNLVLIPGDFGWTDIGEWKTVYDLGKKDFAGNVVISDNEHINNINIQSKNNLIHTGKRLIATLGVEDLIIIDSDDILFICPKDQSQGVKKVVNRLKEEEKKDYL